MTRRLEHGTPEGYAKGCTKHAHCPALTVHGLTCETAHIRFESGERRYLTLYGRNMPAAAIARRLGITPPEAPTPDAFDVAEAAAEKRRGRDAGITDMQEKETEMVMQDTTPKDVTPPAPKPPVKGPAKQAGNSKATAPINDRSTKLAAIRAWARENGIEVATFGRIPKQVEAAYDAGDPSLLKPAGRDETPAPSDDPTAAREAASESRTVPGEAPKPEDEAATRAQETLRDLDAVLIVLELAEAARDTARRSLELVLRKWAQERTRAGQLAQIAAEQEEQIALLRGERDEAIAAEDFWCAAARDERTVNAQLRAEAAQPWWRRRAS
jgi:hypothetical protein